MSLPTTKTPPKNLLNETTILIHGRPKIGKSTWCSQAPGAIFLATEPGLHALDVHQTPVDRWEDILNTCGELSNGQHTFKTVIIDTIDNAFTMCANYICRQFGVQHESEIGYGKGYALIRNEIQRVIFKLGQLPYGLILVSHSRASNEETRTGKHTVMVPTLNDKARELITGMMDIILYCDLEKQSDEKENVSWRRIVRVDSNPDYESGSRFSDLPPVMDLNFSALESAFEAANKTKTKG